MWCFWHRYRQRYLLKRVTTNRWTDAECFRNTAGMETLRRQLRDLIDYLEANTATLVNYGTCRRQWRTHLQCLRRYLVERSTGTATPRYCHSTETSRRSLCYRKARLARKSANKAKMRRSEIKAVCSMTFRL
jgi:phage terminase Nu1 subunit (DNA packaging protein)